MITTEKSSNNNKLINEDFFDDTNNLDIDSSFSDDEEESTNTNKDYQYMMILKITEYPSNTVVEKLRKHIRMLISYIDNLFRVTYGISDYSINKDSIINSLNDSDKNKIYSLFLIVSFDISINIKNAKRFVLTFLRTLYRIFESNFFIQYTTNKPDKIDFVKNTKEIITSTEEMKKLKTVSVYEYQMTDAMKNHEDDVNKDILETVTFVSGLPIYETITYIYQFFKYPKPVQYLKNYLSSNSVKILYKFDIDLNNFVKLWKSMKKFTETYDDKDDSWLTELIYADSKFNTYSINRVEYFYKFNINDLVKQQRNSKDFTATVVFVKSNDMLTMYAISNKMFAASVSDYKADDIFSYLIFKYYVFFYNNPNNLVPTPLYSIGLNFDNFANLVYSGATKETMNNVKNSLRTIEKLSSKLQS